MPRRHRTARERPGPPDPAPTQLGAPEWALWPGIDVRQVTGEKEYRCPGCDLLIRKGLTHLVVVPEGDVELRRHWHTECWRRELRRFRGR